MPNEATMSAMTRVTMLIPVLPNKRLIAVSIHNVTATSAVVSTQTPVSASFSHGCGESPPVPPTDGTPGV